jgi:hypothetical protein
MGPHFCARCRQGCQALPQVSLTAASHSRRVPPRASPGMSPLPLPQQLHRKNLRGSARQATEQKGPLQSGGTPTMVPWTTEPFLSSMVTVSLESFMRKRTSFIVKTLSERYGKKVLLKRTDERPVPCLSLRTTASKTDPLSRLVADSLCSVNRSTFDHSVLLIALSKVSLVYFLKHFLGRGRCCASGTARPLADGWRASNLDRGAGNYLGDPEEYIRLRIKRRRRFLVEPTCLTAASGAAGERCSVSYADKYGKRAPLTLCTCSGSACFHSPPLFRGHFIGPGLTRLRQAG